MCKTVADAAKSNVSGAQEQHRKMKFLLTVFLYFFYRAEAAN